MLNFHDLLALVRWRELFMSFCEPSSCFGREKSRPLPGVEPGLAARGELVNRLGRAIQGAVFMFMFMFLLFIVG